MEDEFYCDLLRDYDGTLLEIQLDNDKVDDATSSPRSLVVACSAIDISLTVANRIATARHEHESPKQPSALGFESDGDEDEWLQFVLRNFDLDVILSELNSSESHGSEGFDQNAASVLNVSLVDIDYNGEDKDIAMSHDSYAEPPREFGELMFPPTPTPVLRPTSWSTGAASIRYQQLGGLPVEPSTLALLPSPVDFSVECQHPQCQQTAVIMNMCYEHADLLFAEQQQQESQTTMARKKRRRAIFSTGTKKKKAKMIKAKTGAAATTTKKARKPRGAQSVKKGTQKQHEKDDSELPKEKKDPPLRSRRNRRISYGDAA